MRTLRAYLAVFLTLLLIGCNNVKKGAIGGKLKDNKSDQGYAFVCNGITIAMHAKVEPIIQSLGEPKDYLEAESCAFQGMERIYTYNGFELHTYEEDGIDYVSAVIFLDDSVSTKEGICLSSSLEDVIGKYGNKYTKELGLYSYKMNRSSISFLLENNEVTSIEYSATSE